MNRATLEPAGEGQLVVTGTLDFETVPALLAEGDAYLAPGARLLVDLRGVSHTNSAGLAMLVAWLRWARERGAELRFAHLPEQMQAAARVTGVAEILPVADAG